MRTGGRLMGNGGRVPGGLESPAFGEGLAGAKNPSMGEEIRLKSLKAPGHAD